MSAPRPPADIAARTPPYLEIKPGARLHRFYTKGPGWDPLFFDRSIEGRLNAPDGTYGVLYCAERIHGAFAETFLRRPGRTLLPSDLIAAKGYVEIRARQELRLARLYGHALSRVGATAQITHGGPPYDVPQEWSRALHDHPDRFDGIAYYARHDDDQICFAIFERAKSKVGVAVQHSKIDEDWFYEILDHYSVGLAPD